MRAHAFQGLPGMVRTVADGAARITPPAAAGIDGDRLDCGSLALHIDEGLLPDHEQHAVKTTRAIRACARATPSGAPSSTRCSTRWRAMRPPNGPSPASTGTTSSPGATTASAAAHRCSSRRPSSTRAAAGRAMREPINSEVIETRARHTASAWCASRCAATSAARTSATCSTTARRPPASAICINSAAIDFEPCLSWPRDRRPSDRPASA